VDETHIVTLEKEKNRVFKKWIVDWLQQMLHSDTVLLFKKLVDTFDGFPILKETENS
jgi:hypothetical protein